LLPQIHQEQVAVNAHQNSLKDLFTIVFKDNRWGNEESVSGAGSALSSPSVLESVKALDEVIRRFGIRSINDVPCGDFYWIPLILGRFPKVEYHGFDIVSDLIKWNRERFPDYDFQVADITQDTLPQVDLIFCKDLFLHLYQRDIVHALRNFKLSGSRFLLVSNIVGVENRELVIDEPGQCRHVDLTAAPYSLPTPLWSTNYLALWSLDAVEMRIFDDLCAIFEVPEDAGDQSSTLISDS